MTRRLPLRPATRSALRRTSLAAGALVLTAALAACGGGDDTDGGGTDGDEGGDSAETALGEDQATGVLLGADDVPEGFVENTEDDDEEDTQVGCLSAIKDLSDVEAETEVESKFEREDETSASGIMSAVNSYDATDTIVGAMATYRDAVTECTSVEETDDEDVTIELAVTVDDEATSDDVAEQVNLRAEGQISSGGGSFPYVVEFQVARVANSIAVVSVFEVGGETGTLDEIDALAETVVGRLVEATQG